MRTLFRAIVFLLIACAAAAVVVTYSTFGRGFGTQDAPSWIETLLAGGMRRLATPAAVRDRRNPVQRSDAVVEEGLQHFADHCATCHANDGSGQTSVGQNLYPRAPDMRAEGTQNLTDGEIFSIIENGIRLTGMPGWSTGTPEGEQASWALVHFIRRLPMLTTGDLERMEALNPKSAETFRQEEEARRFLAGEDLKPSPGRVE